MTKQYKGRTATIEIDEKNVIIKLNVKKGDIFVEMYGLNCI